jgi:hypothetical protein
MKSLKYKRECSVCSTQIFDYDAKTGKLRKNDEYREVDVLLDNNSVMTTGVCTKHESPTNEELSIITEKVHKGWLEEVAYGIGNKAWVNNTGLNLNVVGLA